MNDSDTQKPSNSLLKRTGALPPTVPTGLLKDRGPSSDSTNRPSKEDRGPSSDSTNGPSWNNTISITQTLNHQSLQFHNQCITSSGFYFLSGSDSREPNSLDKTHYLISPHKNFTEIDLHFAVAIIL